MTTALPVHPLLEPIRILHRRIRDEVVRACEEAAVGTLSGVATEAEGDTIYAIDRVAEHELVAEIGRTIATQDEPVLLVAEGLPGGEVVVPEGAARKTVRWVIIVDPIDGTRGVMYQKRPAWILTGVARGPGPCTLADIELAVQTEIPLVKQHLSDELWAVRGQGASAVRVNRLTGEIAPLTLHPSTATSLAHGFAMISRFFPGSRAELAAIDDEVVSAMLGPPHPGKAQLFEDQYISSGGQLYELMAGHDRFVADLRPLFERRRPGGAALCCHPYDLCTELIARELGVLVTDEQGSTLGAPLDVTADVGWIGYANASLKALVEPHLRRALNRRGLID
jgi:fructose-1,6-bisphosphatase/inositol monophosphatase family enzyme